MVQSGNRFSEKSDEIQEHFAGPRPSQSQNPAVPVPAHTQPHHAPLPARYCGAS